MQMYLYREDNQECLKRINDSEGDFMKNVRKQFYLGKIEQYRDDLYENEYWMNQCTEMIVSFPFSVNNNIRQPKFFINNLFSEDMFE